MSDIKENLRKGFAFAEIFFYNIKLLAKMLVHCSCGTTAIAHSKDYRCTTSHDVATCIDEWD